MTAESDPNGKARHEPGAKLDAGKIPVMRGAIQHFPRAFEAVARLSAKGAEKYTWKSWQEVPDGVARYSDALGRHLLAEEIEGPLDNGPNGTQELHATCAAWNALARLELMLRSGECEVGGWKEVPPEPQAPCWRWPFQLK